MAEREVVLDQPQLTDEQAEAVRQATERAERAEAELARMKAHAAHTPQPEAREHPTARRHDHSSPVTPETQARAGEPLAQDDALKQPPSPSSAAGDAEESPEELNPNAPGGLEELRKDSMMAHLLDSLEAGKDIGHYGRLVFSMVARHFLPHREVMEWLMKDKDVDEEKAAMMLRQVEGRDYSPPRRAKILEYQAQQEFPILPDPDDPDCGNLYRNLKFPDEVYEHIGHYQEAKAHS